MERDRCILIISDIILFPNVLFVVIFCLQLPFGVAHLHFSTNLLVFVLETTQLLFSPFQFSVELKIVILPFSGLGLQVHLQFFIFFKVEVVVLLLG